MNQKKLVAIIAVLGCATLIGIGLAQLVFHVDLTVNVGENMKAEITFDGQAVTGGTLAWTVDATSGQDNQWPVTVTNVGNVNFNVSVSADNLPEGWLPSMAWIDDINTANVGETITGMYHLIPPSGFLGSQEILIHLTLTKLA